MIDAGAVFERISRFAGGMSSVACGDVTCYGCCGESGEVVVTRSVWDVNTGFLFRGLVKATVRIQS